MTVPVGVISWAWVMVAVSKTEPPSAIGLVMAVVVPAVLTWVAIEVVA